MKRYRNIPTWFYACRDLNIHLHDTGNLTRRRARVIKRCGLTADGGCHRQQWMRQRGSCDLAVHTGGRCLSLASGVKRNIRSDLRGVCRRINGPVLIHGRSLARAAFIQGEDPWSGGGNRNAYRRRGLACVRNCDQGSVLP